MLLWLPVLPERPPDAQAPRARPTRGFREYRWRVLFRHPSTRRIAKQLRTIQTTFEEQGIRFEEWINRILEIPDRLPTSLIERRGPPSLSDGSRQPKHTSCRSRSDGTRESSGYPCRCHGTGSSPIQVEGYNMYTYIYIYILYVICMLYLYNVVLCVHI